MVGTPACFRGAYNEDPVEWLKTVEWWLTNKRTGGNVDKGKIGHVSGLFRDSAARWFSAIKWGKPAKTVSYRDRSADQIDAEPGPVTYDDFVTEFLDYFKVNDADLWREQAELGSMKQGETEDVESFFDRVERQGRKSRARDEQIRGALLAGLKPSIKAMVQQHDIHTIADVKKWSLVTERSAKDDEKLKNAPTAADSEMKRLQSELQQLKETLERVQLRTVNTPLGNDSHAKSVTFASKPRSRDNSPTPRIAMEQSFDDQDTYGGYDNYSQRDYGTAQEVYPRSWQPSPYYDQNIGGDFYSQNFQAASRWRGSFRGNSRGRGAFTSWGGYSGGYSQVDCPFCGRVPACDANNCRALSVTCFKCGVAGHMQQKCTMGGQSQNRYARC
jgi:hypothetical protein